MREIRTYGSEGGVACPTPSIMTIHVISNALDPCGAPHASPAFFVPSTVPPGLRAPTIAPYTHLKSINHEGLFF